MVDLEDSNKPDRSRVQTAATPAWSRTVALVVSDAQKHANRAANYPIGMIRANSAIKPVASRIRMVVLEEQRNARRVRVEHIKRPSSKRSKKSVKHTKLVPM